MDSKNSDWIIDWISRDGENLVNAFWYSKKINLKAPLRKKILRNIICNASNLEKISWENSWWNNFLNISVKTESEEKFLENKMFKSFSGKIKETVEIKGKRTKWRNFIIKINFYGFKNAFLENIECVFEVGKI